MKNIVMILLMTLPIIACSQEKGLQQSTVQELNKIDFQSNEDIIVLDVRTLKEVNEAHIKGSKHLDVLKTDDFVLTARTMDKEKTYYVICRSGGRSTKAANTMLSLGFENVYNVQGGMNAWQSEGLPTE